MKKMLFLITLFTLIAFVSGAKAIQKPAPEPVQSAASEKPVMEKFSGTIEKVDEKGKIIAVKGKIMNEEKTLTFVINNRTKITKGKAAMTLGDLKKDMQVSIEYKKDMDKMIAVTINISVPENAPKKNR
jgi:hypothetical protein